MIPSRQSYSLMWPILLGCLLFSAIFLGIIYSVFVPMPPDGGWYSYPGYAFYQERDPLENLLEPSALMQLPGGIHSAFGFETRSILVLVHAAWFSIAGSDLLSVKIFGVLQWLILAVLTGSCVWLLVRDTMIASFFALLVLSDSWIISESLADLRPDIPTAIAGMVCLYLMLRHCTRPSVITTTAAGIFAMLTLLIHITGVAAFAGCSTFACIYILLSMADRGRFRLSLLLVPILGVIAFSFRHLLFDFFIPTSISPDIVSFDLWSKLRQVYAAGISAKLIKEFYRWVDYFFISNAMHLIVLASGLAIGSWAILNETKKEYRLIASTIIGFFAAAATITVLDPHFTSSHLVPVVCLGYVAAAPGLGHALCNNRKMSFGWIIIGVILAMVALKVVHGGKILINSIRDGVSNNAVEQLMKKTSQVLLQKGYPQNLVIAPTSLWLYMPHTTSIVLQDTRSKPITASSPLWKGVSGLIVDNDYLSYGWDKTVNDLLECGAAEKIGEVGKRSGGYYLISLQLNIPGCLSTN